jgi:thioredoxin-related protein
MMLSRNPQLLKLFSRTVLFGAMIIALTLSGARAAELVMFEQAGCAWCEAFDREIAPIYGKTEEGMRAPLRRVDSAQALPADLAFIEAERLTPLFVLVDRGHEIGRIRGYPGEDHFWGLLGVLVAKLDRPVSVSPGLGEERAQLHGKSLYASD